ncbi:MAG: nucleotidyltransferase domain-containing protein [Nitrospira sp.]|nr:nucleotidyltransferase domain-containing protein [Nitrospira sp.]
MQVIVKMIFGSHLYGTATPASDRDYKGIFLPPLDDLLAGQAPKTMSESTKVSTTSKNTNLDVDSDLYSLQYFLDLAAQGETVALDMLHAPERALTGTSSIWESLVAHRDKFYTRNLSSLVRYARRQAAKYGVKGSRLHEAKRVLEFFREQSGAVRVLDVWESLPAGDHIRKTQNERDAIYEVCGKKMVANGRCAHYADMLEHFIQRYGDRARQAEHNEGIDWKAISHAFRAAYQVKRILQDGGFTYPLPETDYIRAVKQGALPYVTEVAPRLDALIDEVEGLSENSALPEQVNREWWKKWLIEVVRDAYGIKS